MKNYLQISFTVHKVFVFLASFFSRWFDKCFQLIVDCRGNATINFEHSWGDGVAILRLMEESYRDVNKNSFVSPHQPVDLSVEVPRYLKEISKFTVRLDESLFDIFFKFR